MAESFELRFVLDPKLNYNVSCVEQNIGKAYTKLPFKENTKLIERMLIILSESSEKAVVGKKTLIAITTDYAITLNYANEIAALLKQHGYSNVAFKNSKK